jgi:23S rRNA (uracil1939-C5)-methyltransferase
VRSELEIEDLAPGGEGLGRSDGRAVFVPFTAPGDRVVAEVPAGEGPAHGALVSILAPGAERVAAPCVHFGCGVRAQVQPDEAGPERAGGSGGPSGPPRQDACGGCEWLHVRYEAQLAAKARALRETLRRIGRIDPDGCGLRPILASPAPLRYRARAKLHLDRASGRLAFFRRRSHVPVPLRECHLLSPALDALREEVGPALVAARLSPREVTLEWSDDEGRGSILLALEPTPAARERAEALLAALPRLAGAVLRGEDGRLAAAGDPVLRLARAPGRPEAGWQRSRPDVFQQANRGANALLVEAALSLLRPEGEEVLELFCGAGNFTAPLAARAGAVAAVEAQGPALELARADLAAAANVRFFAGDALKLAHALARERGPGARRFGAVLLDPPREGARGIGPALRELGAPRAVYVSCDPATLARDARACVEAGYRVAVVQPVDMFPQTHHVECAILLERA